MESAFSKGCFGNSAMKAEIKWGGMGLPDGAVTPFDTNPERRNPLLKVQRMMLAADGCSATSPPVFTAGLIGVIRVDVSLILLA